ncbi:MAG: IMP dehydrogenase [Nitrospinae bacterium]|nr:IMP dehydrogenase [Nitrospinota bacterium]
MIKGPLREYLTFDDVLLLPGKSAVLPKDVSIKSRLTKTIPLNCPLLSSPMDTVTDFRLAIALAQEGGVGIIHKNFTIEKQAEEVEKVKRYSSGMIADPITLSPKQSIRDALEVKKKYNISGIPITENGKLVGIVTNRDLRFEKRMNAAIEEVMTKENLVTVHVGAPLEKAKDLLHKHRIEKLLVVDKHGALKGLITIKDIEKSIDFPDSSKDSLGRLIVGAAVGVGKDRDWRAEALVKAGVDVLVIDTAHGHSEGVMKSVKILRKKYPNLPLIAGNVATAEATRDLIKVGASAVKVGIGPGSICTTRIVSGVGVPQISAVAECAEAAVKSGTSIISDGGIKYSGDIVKAIAAGADCVMIGGIFAGTEESPGEKILFQGRSFKEYRGMGSIGAMQEGSADRYFQDGQFSETKLVPEGVEARVPYKGSLSFIVHQLTGGLRSGMGYCGAATIKELQKKGRFIRISNAGLRESHVHDVIITKEAPNYRED